MALKQAASTNEHLYMENVGNSVKSLNKTWVLIIRFNSYKK